MRVYFLAAAMLCFMALPGSTEPIGARTMGGLAAAADAVERGGSTPWLRHAINDVGTNPTGWKRQWCAKSVNLWLNSSGKRGCGGNSAVSCLQAGKRLSGPQVGALAVMKHHVGIVKAVNGNAVTLVSGNHAGHPGARTVGVGNYSKSRIIGYVWPH